MGTVLVEGVSAEPTLVLPGNVSCPVPLVGMHVLAHRTNTVSLWCLTFTAGSTQMRYPDNLAFSHQE